MNCEKCQELLSDFLDGALRREDHATLSAHLDECLSCFGVRRDLDSIVNVARAYRSEYIAPPNEQVLWLRIRNVIESERLGTATARPTPNAQGESWWSRLMGRSWELSLPQMTGAVAAIVVAVSLATAFSIRSVQNFGADSTQLADVNGFDRRPNAPRINPLGLNDRMRKQQIAIDYWNNRVEQRKVRWNAEMREAFERNMQVIDHAVNDSREALERDPQDEVSEEMLNSALNDKMELLKEFSEL